MKRLYTIGIFIFTVISVFGQKNTGLPKDLGALEMMGMGKKFMKNTNYPQSLRMFEDAMIRGYSQTTTAAIYLTGLSYFYMGDYPNAQQYFKILIDEYPISKYTDEAKYHLALIQLSEKDAAKYAGALESLYKLLEMVPDGDLAKECHDAALDHIYYKLPSNIVKSVYDKVPKTYKQEVGEAYMYRLVQENKREEAKQFLPKFTANGGTKSNFLEILLMEKKVYPKPPERNIMKIAVFLPLYVDNAEVSTLKEVPAKSQVALELYEGLQKAIEEYSLKTKKQIFVKVFDTQRDNAIIGTQLAELETLYPDIIIGEVFNRQSRFIADWAESKGIPQIVPLSPTLGVAEGKPQVMLARPSAATHGKQMARHAFLNLGLKKVAVWNDKKSVTLEMANAFDKEFKTMGGETVTMQIDSMYQRAIGQIPYCMNGVKNAGCDGMYVPMASEEGVGLILSYLTGGGIKVMASPDVESFYTMDRELKEKIGILYTTTFLPDENSAAYVSFHNSFLTKYGIAPTEINLRGYDLGIYIMSMLDEYSKDKGKLNEFFKKHNSVKAIHANFDFQGQSDNQGVHIMQYVPGGTVKRNR